MVSQIICDMLYTARHSQETAFGGLHIQDQYDNVGGHTQKGLDFCEKMINFLKEKATVEQEYARSLNSHIPDVNTCMGSRTPVNSPHIPDVNTCMG
ncbi:hypothetical protein ACOMHN_004619 [Nucella lapillus]